MPGRYAKFWDMTFLYEDWETNGFIPYEDSEEYFEQIREYLQENPEDFQDGDILFVGSTYETRPEYGFATVINNGKDFEGGEYPRMDTPGIYYKKAVEDVNKYWNKIEGQDYFDEDWIQRLKNRGVYEKPSVNWKRLHPKVRLAAKIRKENEEILGDYFPSGIADKISRLSVFGKKSKVRSKKKVDSELVYLRKFL